MADTVTLTIDGIQVTVNKGTFVIEAAKKAGLYIANLCYNPDMRPFGACRMCTIGLEGKRGMQFEIACATEVKDGMVVYTENTNAEVLEVKKFIMESLLVDHPLDCPICPASGACDLQNSTWHFGLTENRMARDKMWSPEDYLSPAILIKRDRCVVCGQCVRVCDEIVGAHALAFVNRGIETYIDSAWGDDLTQSPCTSCGMCVEVCPVGCLMHVQSQDTYLHWTQKRTTTTCGICSVGCTLMYEADANTGIMNRCGALENTGVNDSRTCVKGRYGWQYVNSPDRLTMPLLRRGGQFVEVSWDEAYSFIASRLPEYQGDAFAAVASTKCSNEDNYMLMKLTRGVMKSNNIDSTFRLTGAATLTALNDQFGSGAMTNTIQDLKDYSAVHLYVGTNVDDSQPVAAMLWQEAMQRGRLKAIVIDPCRTKMAERAEVFLQIRPGTDNIVLNAIAKIILDRGFQTDAFIGSRTEGFETWRASLSQVSVSQAADAAGVRVSDIMRAAELYATGGGKKSESSTYPPAAILYGNGITQQVNAVENIRAMANLALLTGNVGRSGGGLGNLRDGTNDQGVADMGCLPNYLPGYAGLGNAQSRTAIQEVWDMELPTRAGLTYTDMFRAASQGRVKAMWIMGDNPMLGAPDLRLVQNGLERLEFLVVQDLFLTETARFADVVLPAASAQEKEGTFTNTERRIQRINKVVAPIGFAKPDWKIYAELMTRLSIDAPYKKAEDVMKEIGRVNPLYRGVTSYTKLDRPQKLMTYKPGLVYNRMSEFAFERMGLQWPAETMESTGTPILYTDSFLTANGKARFVAAIGAQAAPQSSGRSRSLILGRTLSQDRTGSMTLRSHVLSSLDTEPDIELSAGDGKALGLSTGDYAQITSNATGQAVVARVKITERQPDGVAFMPWMMRDAPGMVLVSADYDQRTGTPLVKTLTVRLEKTAAPDQLYGATPSGTTAGTRITPQLTAASAE